MAKIVYVTKSGSDSNSGLTLALAKLTIAGANAVAVATDTVLIGEGTWTETNALGAVSNCTYQGASMFRTTIVGNLKNNMAIYILKDLRINATSWSDNINTTNSATAFTRVFFDWSLLTAGSYSLAFIGGAATIKNCVFYYVDAFTNFVFNGGTNNAILRIYNCIAYRSSRNAVPGFYYNYGATNSIWMKNCIFYQVDPQFHYLTYGPFDQSQNHVHVNNIYYNYQTSSDIIPYLDATEKITNPLFENVTSGDFRLTSSSPAIGMGTSNLA